MDGIAISNRIRKLAGEIEWELRHVHLMVVVDPDGKHVQSEPFGTWDQAIHHASAAAKGRGGVVRIEGDGHMWQRFDTKDGSTITVQTKAV